MLIIFKTVIRPILEYGCFAFAGAAECHLIKLKRVQWKAIRICFSLMQSTHTQAVEVIAGILPLNIRYEMLIGRMISRARVIQEELWQDMYAIVRKRPSSRIARYAQNSDALVLRSRESEEAMTVVVYKQAMEVWQADWEASDLGRFCFSILPTVSDSPWFSKLQFMCRREIVLISRIVSNHYRLNAHLARFEIVAQSLCTECSTYMDVDHVLFHCSVSSSGRADLLYSCAGIQYSRDLCALSLQEKSVRALRAIDRFVQDNNLCI
uniref:Putative secreted protein n=1 Tax=Lutzomyia longipalpis TaxID=7200 RepID=A0A7G3AH77_LUTLO